MQYPEAPRVALLVETSTTWARSILDGINRYLRKKNYWQIFLQPHGANESIRLPAGWVGEGVIADIKDEVMAKHLHGLDIPVINISQVSFPGLAFPTITTDIKACTRMAAEYFSERGYENFAYLQLEKNILDSEIMQGFSNYVKREGGTLFTTILKKRAWGVADWNLSIHELADWLKDLPKPVGLFSWAIGREVVHACHLARIKMPEEVSLLMHSDDEIFLEMSHIPMSGIIHPGAEIGHRAGEMLDGLMSGRFRKKRREPTLELIQPSGIKTRQSSDVMAIGDSALRMAIGYARQHAGETLKVRDMVRHAGVSRRALEQRFSQTLERSPADYIRSTRMARAQELLRETTLPIPDVASAAGYSSPEYMARVFRKELGVSPLRFRRKVTGR